VAAKDIIFLLPRCRFISLAKIPGMNLGRLELQHPVCFASGQPTILDHNQGFIAFDSTTAVIFQNAMDNSSGSPSTTKFAKDEKKRPECSSPTRKPPSNQKAQPQNGMLGKLQANAIPSLVQHAYIPRSFHYSTDVYSFQGIRSTAEWKRVSGRTAF
jgi:hypothetical protein